MKTNYHTHTELCGHAIGNVDDYVRAAIGYGFNILGMSDHGLMPPGVKRLYMNQEIFKNYLLEIDNAIEKYPQIKIYKALEIEYFRGDDGFYKKLLDKLDYMILGVHYTSDDKDYYYKSSFHINTKEGLYNYCELALAGIESGLFKILAHPDVFMCGYKNWDQTTIEISKKIIEAAIRNNVLLEVNSQGIRNAKKHSNNVLMYPNTNFFKLVKEYNAKVIISSDAHEPKRIYDDEVKQAIAFSRGLGLRVVEEVKF